MRVLLVAGGLALVGQLAACGSSDGPPDPTASIAHIQAQTRAAQRRNEVRAKRLADDLARAKAARRRDAEAEVASEPASTGSDTSAPAIVQRPIPFPEKRKQEMADYSERHYGMRAYALTNPKVIVEHYTVSADAQSAINTFSSDVPDVELHELPGVCSHFVIDKDGTIYQLVDLGLMCRHTVGLNYTAIGIEHAGFSDQEILSDKPQLDASLKLTNYLRCRFGIDLANVIGHNESLSSPYHRENVARLKGQTHGDWTKADMDIYRGKLEALHC